MFDFRFGFQTASEPFGDDRLADVALEPTPDPTSLDPLLEIPVWAEPASGDGAARLPAGPAPSPAPPSADGLAAQTMLVRPARDAADAAAEAPGDDRPAILVVEDNADTRMLLERILRSAYAVTAVADARAALVAMNARRFRGLVLDINLGGRETGTDVLRVARSLDGYAGVFAIALTAYALPGDRERLLETGFDEYLSKPFSRQSLLDALAAGVRA